jgi:hypothetical protein
MERKHIAKPSSSLAATLALLLWSGLHGAPALAQVQVAVENGDCPDGTTILYRLYNNGGGGFPSHRLTTNLNGDAWMVRDGWILEGHERTFAFACVPSGP